MDITKMNVTEIMNYIAFHSYFRKGKQYVTIGGKEYSVNGLINFFRCSVRLFS